jgi:hypothetical protein
MMAEGQGGLSEAARQQINMAIRRAELAHKIASRVQSRPGIRIVEQD